MATAPAEITEADILSQVIAPGEPTLSEASAKAILALSFNQRAVESMNVLAEKSRRDELSETERELLAKYQRVGSFLNLIQAKARLSLSRGPSGN